MMGSVFESGPVLPAGGWIKVCGVTSVADACRVRDEGADAIGLNLWPGSPRCITLEQASAIAAAVSNTIDIVVVTVDFSFEQLQQIEQAVEPQGWQLHGDEPDALLRCLGGRAYKAIGLAEPADVQRALRTPGPFVLVDARDAERRGGTGQTPPLALATAVSAARPTVLAGGLRPDNVAEAIALVRPWGVDVASGVEEAPGRKDARRLGEFVAAARAAFALFQ